VTHYRYDWSRDDDYWEARIAVEKLKESLNVA